MLDIDIAVYAAKRITTRCSNGFMRLARRQERGATRRPHSNKYRASKFVVVVRRV